MMVQNGRSLLSTRWGGVDDAAAAAGIHPAVVTMGVASAGDRHRTGDAAGHAAAAGRHSCAPGVVEARSEECAVKMMTDPNRYRDRFAWVLHPGSCWTSCPLLLHPGIHRRSAAAGNHLHRHSRGVCCLVKSLAGNRLAQRPPVPMTACRFCCDMQVAPLDCKVPWTQLHAQSCGAQSRPVRLYVSSEPCQFADASCGFPPERGLPV